MKFSTLFKDTIIYGITNYLGVFASLFLTPIYTRYFLKEEYGVMEIFNTWSSFALMIIPLGLTGSIIRFYDDFKDNQKKIDKIVGTTLFHLVIQSALYLISMLLIKDLFLKMYNIDQKHSFIYLLLIVNVIMQVFIGYFLSFLRVKYEKRKYLIASILNLVILSVVGLVLVLIFKQRIESFFIASCLSSSITLITLLVFLRKHINLTFDKNTSVKLFKYSIHLLSAGLLFQFTNLVDRYILSNHDPSLELMGTYSIALKLGNLISLIISAFSLAWFPHAMRIKDDSNAKQIYSTFHSTYIVVISMCISLFFLFRKEILLIMAPNYMETYFQIPIISFYLVILGFAYFYSLGIHIRQRTKYFSIFALFTIVINISISLILVEYIGVYGIILGTLIGYIFWMTAQLIVSQKIFKINFNFKYLLLGLFLPLTTLYFTQLIDFTHYPLVKTYTYKGGAGLFIICICFYFTPNTILKELNPIIKKIFNTK